MAVRWLANKKLNLLNGCPMVGWWRMSSFEDHSSPGHGQCRSGISKQKISRQTSQPRGCLEPIWSSIIFFNDLPTACHVPKERCHEEVRITFTSQVMRWLSDGWLMTDTISFERHPSPGQGQSGTGVTSQGRPMPWMALRLPQTLPVIGYPTR